MLLRAAIFGLFLSTVYSVVRPRGVLKFPKNFVWATATSAFQVEGGIVGTGRGKSIWDRYVEEHPNGNQTADVSCDSYHKFAEDVKILKRMKVKAYRFSISWPRLFPNGLTEDINAEGVEYYHKLIDLLVANGIQPMVTLYHWDLPLALGDQGGWINREIVGWFGDYARFCFEEYGSKVKYWITINEAYIASLHGYCGQGEEFAPGGFKKNCEWSLYLAAHHMLLAHGRAANIYKKEFQPTQNGVIGITNLAVWYEPLTKEDEEVAKRAFEFQFGWLTHPIYGDGGDYPEVMKAKMEELKEKEGRAKSRLPQFSKQEIEELKGSADFLGINYYYGFLTSREEQKNSDLINMTTLDQWERDASMFSYYDPKWEPVGDNNSWIRNYPDGLYNTLNFVKTNYANIPVYITENGCMDTPGEDLRDVTRLRYLRNHINAVYRAISDGSNVKVYTAWSLMDNFEWNFAYGIKFGLYRVDFSSSDRTRIPKQSAEWYGRVVLRNGLLDY